MSNPAEGIKDLLVTAGEGTFAATSGWGIFIGEEPIEPETTVTIFNSGGKTPNPKWLIDYPSINIRIRGAVNGYQAAYTKTVAVKDALLGVPSQDLNGDRWVSITGIGDIIFLGFNESRQARFSLNYSLILEPATGTNRTAL